MTCTGGVKGAECWEDEYEPSANRETAVAQSPLECGDLNWQGVSSDELCQNRPSGNGCVSSTVMAYNKSDQVGRRRHRTILDSYPSPPPMANAKSKNKRKKAKVARWVTSSSHVYPLKSSTRGSSAKQRLRILSLPPEIIRMILQYLADCRNTLRACSLTARHFRYTALSLLGRHLTLNTADRLKECSPLITRGAFKHVRSLELGANAEETSLGSHWRTYLVILKAFTQYRALNRLWLSELSFSFVARGQKGNLRETIVALGFTVTELGLYECHFSSYKEMISLIRSFPLCNFLFVRDCTTGGKPTGKNVFAGLPENQLSIRDLQLSCSSPSNQSTNVSNLIEDAALDVGSLTSLVCDVGNSERTRRIAAAVYSSPVEHFQVACAEPEGFQGEHTTKLSTIVIITLG